MFTYLCNAPGNNWEIYCSSDWCETHCRVTHVKGKCIATVRTDPEKVVEINDPTSYLPHTFRPCRRERPMELTNDPSN